MPAKVELVQIRRFGEIVDDSILFVKQNWKPLLRSYFSICGFFWVAGLILSVFNQTQIFALQENGESIYSVTYISTAVLNFLNIIFVILTGLCFVTLYKEKENQAPSVEEVWTYVKYYFFRVVGSSIALLALWAA